MRLCLKNLCIFVIALLANFIFIKTIIATEIYKDELIQNCLKSADNPENKTGGPKYDDLNIPKALKNCNKALKKYPNSKEVLRSLARVYFKQKNYNKAHNLALKSSNMSDPYSDWLLGSLYRYALGVEKDIDKFLAYTENASQKGYLKATQDLATFYMTPISFSK